MKYLIKNKRWKINEDYNLDKILYLLIDRPNYINSFNEFKWINNKKLWHRDYDLPAIVSITGNVWWFKNSRRYRKNNKPSCIFC